MGLYKFYKQIYMYVQADINRQCILRLVAHNAKRDTFFIAHNFYFLLAFASPHRVLLLPHPFLCFCLLLIFRFLFIFIYFHFTLCALLQCTIKIYLQLINMLRANKNSTTNGGMNTLYSLH